MARIQDYLMVRLSTISSSSPGSILIVEEVHPECVEVFYIPEKEKLSRSGLDFDKAPDYRVKLLLISGQDNFVTLYPVNTLAGHEDFLKPKYEKVMRITLAGFDFTTPDDVDGVLDLLESLPSSFVKDYDYGLGLLKDYRFIVNAVEELSDCAEIVIAKGVSTGIEEGDPAVFNISYRDFEDARKSVNRIASHAQQAARSVKGIQVFNLFASRIGEEEKPIALGRHPLTRLVARATQGDEYLEEAEQEAILNALSKNTKAIAETKPEKLAKLHNDIELVTLEVLIEQYTVMLNQRLNESRWQNFFNKNPFILSLVFGYPVVKVQDQASIGGRKLSGSGEKITDFLVKNSLTNNTALFEIKTPQTNILNKKSYREGVFTPSSDLSGAINQALDQKYQFQKHIAQSKETSRVYDLESYAVHSCLIIGRMPDDVDRQKSLELFRRNSKDVQIVTFDELLKKLRQLHQFLATGEVDTPSC
jgi:Domain of unknown function (DUF4263)